MTIRIALPFLLGFVGSVLSIVVAYTDYGLLDVRLSLALRQVEKWHWFWIATGFTSVSCLVPFAAHYFYRDWNDQLGYSIAAYAFGLLWIPLLVVYPGTAHLGVESDEAAGFAMSGICLSQYLVARIITKRILRKEEGKT